MLSRKKNQQKETQHILNELNSNSSYDVTTNFKPHFEHVNMNIKLETSLSGYVLYRLSQENNSTIQSKAKIHARFGFFYRTHEKSERITIINYSIHRSLLNLNDD